MVLPLQRLSEIISVSSDDTKPGLIEVYNSLAASIVSPCVVRNDDGRQCGERAIKLACFKSRGQSLNLTIYAGICPLHLTYLAELPEEFETILTRYITGDMNRCEAKPYLESLAGDNLKANG